MNNKLISSHRGEEPENGVLYLVGTPIGNLSDITPRAINVLKKVNLIACEDTRNTRKIMAKYNFHNILESFHKVNIIKKIPKIIDYLKSGQSIAIVSDAGMPGICDPGKEIVLSAKENNINVICIPGPCAALTALVTSGFESSKFIFEGFLPRKNGEREIILKEINQREKTTVLYESPHRLKKLLKELKDYCGGEREISISRELTKIFEESFTTNLNKINELFKDQQPKGEFTIVIKGISEKSCIDYDQEYLKSEINELVEAGLTLSRATKYLAKKKNLSKNIIYNLCK
tara:strand:- start:50893 stop:51759 length:867 start_codon:yes stop_codon:yes gene_type:complete